MTFFDTSRTGISDAFRGERVAHHVSDAVWGRLALASTLSCLITVYVLALVHWWVADAVVPWDSKNHFYPMYRFLGDALRHATIPLWNPYHFSGYPAIADPQSLLFTPSMLLAALLMPEASMSAFDGMILLHLLLGGIGMLALARRWCWHPTAGFLSALVFMLGGAASSRLQHTGMIISYAWFPLALWSLEAALDRRSLRFAVVAAFFATLMALGRDQVAYLLCMALAGAVFRQAFHSKEAIGYLRDRLPVIGCAGAITLGCMIVPILLTLQFVGHSNRPGIAYGTALEGSLDPINLLTLLSPNMFGSLDRIYDYWGPGAATAAGNDWTDRTIDYLFVGTLPIVLIAWHGVAGGRLVERGVRSFALMFLCALVYALGRHTPIFSFIFDCIPGVSLYRRPADATFLLNIAIAFAAGYLLHRFIEDGPPDLQPWTTKWTARALSLASIAILIGAGLAFARNAGRFDASLQRVTVSVGAAIFVALALFLFRARHRRRLIAAILVGATAGQLLWRNSASPLNAEPASVYSAYNGLTRDELQGLALLQSELKAHEIAGAQPRTEILGLNGSWQNAAMVFKLQDTLGYNPLRIASYERAVGAAESAADPNLRMFPNSFRGYNSRLAALLGLDYLVLDRPVADLPRQFPRPRATLLFAGEHFYLYRLEHAAVPRVSVATHLKAVDSDGVIEQGEMPLFEPDHEALVEKADVAALHDGSLTASPEATTSTTKAAITVYKDNHVTVAVEAERSGVLVLHDLIYPGWRAAVDGTPASIIRVNLMFRGVEVPPGHHVVEFSFHPLSAGNLWAAAVQLVGGHKR